MLSNLNSVKLKIQSILKIGQDTLSAFALDGLVGNAPAGRIKFLNFVWIYVRKCVKIMENLKISEGPILVINKGPSKDGYVAMNDLNTYN